jgi:hypothetical protein
VRGSQAEPRPAHRGADPPSAPRCQPGQGEPLQARFRRVLRHRGPKKAVVALAHTLLRIVYHVLADGTT